jgi:putative membrane protein
VLAESVPLRNREHERRFYAEAGRRLHPGEGISVEDATRRTRLANERTYLAWWRTGLATLAVSFAAGRLVPELSGGPRWPFEVIGVAFALIGIALIVYGYRRHEEVEAALDRGDYASLPSRVTAFFALAGAVLGLATIVVVVVHPH